MTPSPPSSPSPGGAGQIILHEPDLWGDHRRQGSHLPPWERLEETVVTGAGGGEGRAFFPSSHRSMKPWPFGDFGEPVVPKGCGRLFSEGTGGGTEKGKSRGPGSVPVTFRPLPATGRNTC